jgi:hypothetical protein
MRDGRVQEYIYTPWKRLLREPAFLVCAFVLAFSACGMLVGSQYWHLRKAPLALRKSLDELDPNRLSPYEVVARSKIVDEAIEEALGTQDYIQWQFRNPQLDSHHPFYTGGLFITYYTGNPDKVPHVPDWCYVGSGGIIEKTHEEYITAPDCGVEERNHRLRIRVLEIKIPGSGMSVSSRKIVSYVFSVNGDYACTRTEVRLKQGNWRDRYAYFSKVEIWFDQGAEASLAENLVAMEDLYRKVLPLLYSEHWPDWDAARKDKK